MLTTWHDSLTTLLTNQGYTEGFPISKSDQKTHYIIFPTKIDDGSFSDNESGGSAKFEYINVSYDVVIMCIYNKNNLNTKVKEMLAICEDLLKALNSYDNWASNGRFRCREIYFEQDEENSIIEMILKTSIDGHYNTD